MPEGEEVKTKVVYSALAPAGCNIPKENLAQHQMFVKQIEPEHASKAKGSGDNQGSTILTHHSSADANKTEAEAK